MTQKVLITGATGYIGNQITRMLAASAPNLEVYAMSRSDPVTTAKKMADTARFKNVTYV